MSLNFFQAKRENSIATNTLNTADLRLTALDMLISNVMIADENLNIVHINQSLMKFLREAEADIQKDLPAFSVANLIGKNIDIFYKNSPQPRDMTQSMAPAHKTSIRIGQRLFGLVASPLNDANNHRIGTVVEWSDSDTLDNAGQVAAIKKASAVIEFNLDGTIITANENFCNALGYTLSEIQGKHHSLFVEDSYKSSSEYTDFWDTLRRGEYMADQFKRFGKNGKAVWIQASYNPILDLNGRVFKVVKYATDITKQIELLDNVRELVDDLERSVNIATRQSTAGAIASEQTSHNVQAVASGAEELSASVREIAESMAKSRTAAENAYDKTMAADQSTQALTDAAKAMGGVVQLIQNIAGQINLLALNATIESARAGEAGKGFAVVASEVKNLSRQATEATDEISKEIQRMQLVSGDVVTALSSIKLSIESVREFVTSTSSAVEEQSAVAGEMSANMQQASTAVNTISANISEIASAVKIADAATKKTKDAAQSFAR